VLDEIHKKGSGIEEKVLLSQYDFSTGIVGDFFSVVSDKIQHRIRSKMLEWERKTPNAPLPVAPTELYDLSQLQQNIVSVKLQENEPTKIVYLRNDKDSYENRREAKSNNSSKKRECEYCKTEYTYNHKKQKYCSDSCRGKAWEERKGTKLTKRKAK